MHARNFLRPIGAAIQNHDNFNLPAPLLLRDIDARKATRKKLLLVVRRDDDR
jgi:hypothetical protein